MIAPKVGAPPPLGTDSTWKAAPAAVVFIVPEPLPRTTPLLVRVVTPVPPTLTPSVPEVIVAADKSGISAAVKLPPRVTRPLASTATLV